MFQPIHAALFFTVVLLVSTAYFLMGGLPLLMLKHDTPVDARFVRSFFNVYYKVTFIAASGAAISYGLSAHLLFALGMAIIAGLAIVLRTRLLGAMSHFGERIQSGDTDAVNGFRKAHSQALSINLVQLAALVWGVIQIGRS